MCPGKLCDGTIENAAKPIKDSKAYCQGMGYRASDTALNAPKTDNPYLADTAQADAWDAGWDLADAAAGSTISDVDAGCCALRGAAVSA